MPVKKLRALFRFRRTSSPPVVRRPGAKLSGYHAEVATARSRSGKQLKAHEIDYLCVPPGFATGHIWKGPDRGATGIPRGWSHFRGHEISHGRCYHHAAIETAHQRRKKSRGH